MSLSRGTKLGTYEITEELGAGGMGVVYRARDTKLHRDVALKLLPDAFSNDADRLARFTREAQTLASLNHPHIAQIYGLEESNGVRALVMEYAPGEDLSVRIGRGPLPVEDALQIALQIAQALEAAHEKGIVHRDLKPSNILVTPEGKVKLLDFGLAKALSGETDVPLSRSAELSNSPTRSNLMTEEGLILGTVSYMSPEQAKGKAVDKRTDIWAFGVVLFEMLTGKQLFAGETVSDVIVAVLTLDPEWKSLPVSIPNSILVLLRRCLDREVTQRLRDIGEARVVLSQKEATPPELAPVASRKSSRSILTALILALVVGLVAFLAGRFGTPVRSIPMKKDVVTGSVTLLTDQSGIESEPSLSPDGRNLAFVKETNGQLDVYVMRVGGRNSVNLTTDYAVDDVQPAFSPDGQSIAFRSERDRGGIFLMGSTGESVRRVTDTGYDPAWSPDGKKLAIASAFFTFPQDRPSRSSLSIVDISSGTITKLTPDSADAVQPSWSPNGYRIAYWGLRENSGRRDIWTIATDGSETKSGGIAVTDDAFIDWSPTWSPDGSYLYFSSNRGGALNLWRIAIDERTGKVNGAPAPMTVPAGWAGHPTISADGKQLAYANVEWRSRLQRLALDPKTEKVLGAPVSILESANPIRDHAVSPDGKWMAFSVLAGSQEDLFVISTDGKNLRRLTDDLARDRGPSWHPGSEYIGFYSDRSGSYELWRIRADGSGLEQVTRNSGRQVNYPIYSPDGLRLVHSSTKAGWTLFAIANPQAVTTMPEWNGQTRFWPLDWSPDGARITGELMRFDGSPEDVAIFNLAEKTFQRLNVSPAGIWVSSTWLSDSRRIVFRDRRGIFLIDTAGGKPVLLLSIGGYSIGRSLGIADHDRTITYSQTATEGDIWMLNLTSTN